MQPWLTQVHSDVTDGQRKLHIKAKRSCNITAPDPFCYYQKMTHSVSHMCKRGCERVAACSRRLWHSAAGCRSCSSGLVQELRAGSHYLSELIKQSVWHECEQLWSGLQRTWHVPAYVCGRGWCTMCLGERRECERGCFGTLHRANVEQNMDETEWTTTVGRYMWYHSNAVCYLQDRHKQWKGWAYPN